MNRKEYEKNLVSIVTPTYNGESYISGYLDSVLAQTYSNLELILVDDGSTDRTVAVAESYRKRLENRGIRYRILQAEHKNASAALGYGLPYVSGEYLIWPDSDDVLRQDSIEIRVKFLKEHPQYQCVRSLSYYFDPKTKERRLADEQRGNLQQEELFWDILEARTFVCCGCYMLKSGPFFDIYPDGKIPVYDVGQNFQMLLPFMYSHKCPTIETELYGVAVRKGSHSRRELTWEQSVKKYRDYELLIDDISGICNIKDKKALKRIRRWKGWRRFDLAVQYGKYTEMLKAWFYLIRGGEAQMGILIKKIGWMWVKNTRLSNVVYDIHLFWAEKIKKRGLEIQERMKTIIQNKEWERYKYKKQRKIKGEPTIIASNCVGTLIYHDMKLPWNSPTVNLSFNMPDFIKLVENLQWYMEQELRVGEDPECKYPVGILGDIRINFVHYKSFDDAAAQWELRKKRIDWNKLFIFGCEKEGCTYEILQRFDRLPYANKVIFTKREYPEFKSAYYIKGFEESDELGVVTLFKNQFLKRRYMDDFDYISFLNEKNN